MVNHPLAKLFYDWLDEAGQTIEIFYATIVRFHVDENDHTITQDVQNPKEFYYNGITPTWRMWWGHPDPCHGDFVNGICVYAVEDLPRIWQLKSELEDHVTLVLNKFKKAIDPLAPFVHFQKLIYQSCLPLLKTNEGLFVCKGLMDKAFKLIENQINN